MTPKNRTEHEIETINNYLKSQRIARQDVANLLEEREKEQQPAKPVRPTKTVTPTPTPVTPPEKNPST